MTPQQWLAENNREPWNLNKFWYWRSEEDLNHSDPEDELDFVLPDNIFDIMPGRITYPGVRLCLTKEQAIKDFRETFLKLYPFGEEMSITPTLKGMGLRE